MKIRTILWALAIGLAIGAYLSSTTLLKAWMEGALSQAAGRRVTIESVSLTFPFGIRLTKLTVPNLPAERAGSGISVETMSLRLPFSSTLQGRTGPELELVGPRLTAARDSEGGLLLPIQMAPQGGASAQPQALPFSRLRIREGRLSFIDQAVHPEVTWVLKDLTVDLSPGPRLGGYSLAASASLETGANEVVGRLQVEGEILPDAALPTYEGKITISHEKIWHLAPYIRPVLGASPSEGACIFETNISLQEGRIIAQNTLQAKGVRFPTEEPTVLGPNGNKLVSLLKDSDGSIQLSFVVMGKLGEKLNWNDLMAAALRQAMRQAMTRSIQKVLTDTEVKPVEELIRKGLESLGR